MTLLLSACGQGIAQLEGDTPPEADALASTAQELISCAARSETGYENGRAFAITVVTVDGKPAERATANAYALMQAAALRDGVRLSVVSGFRSMSEQRYLYACYVNCACNNCNLAASPGYSNHQSGEALDLNTGAAGVYGWLTRNAARFGFYRTVPSEDWHWEFLGPSPGPGPCDAGGGATPVVRFDNLEAGGWYTNGLWMRVQASSAVRFVTYTSDGFTLGASEHRDDGFSARYVFSGLGDRTIVATAFDADRKQLGVAQVKVKVTAGDTQRGSLDFESPADGGWFENGIWLKVNTRGPVARVRYSAGGFALGESTDAAGQFPVRATFTTLGWRVITAVAVDARGVEVARRSTVVRLTP
ncbi:MAG: D-alanyl-D-alanine carboxypeptidase family protein [Myxococcaceae bacterium]|nr:D-alanyl-D-alanine carboxypeptidase family protein [Myxococcaceae bacterium]